MTGPTAVAAPELAPVTVVEPLPVAKLVRWWHRYHRWTRWSLVQRRGGGFLSDTAARYYQRRECVRCGLVQEVML